MPNRSEYQPLAQGLEDDEETDVVEGLSPAPRPSPRQRRPGHIDLSKLDTLLLLPLLVDNGKVRLG